MAYQTADLAVTFTCHNVFYDFEEARHALIAHGYITPKPTRAQIAAAAAAAEALIKFRYQWKVTPAPTR